MPKIFNHLNLFSEWTLNSMRLSVCENVDSDDSHDLEFHGIFATPFFYYEGHKNQKEHPNGEEHKGDMNT